jgi:hypothetical protein
VGKKSNARVTRRQSIARQHADKQPGDDTQIVNRAATRE